MDYPYQVRTIRALRLPCHLCYPYQAGPSLRAPPHEPPGCISTCELRTDSTPPPHVRVPPFHECPPLLLRCMFTSPPPQDAIPACSQVGVLGVLPGIIGTIQATEAIKFLLKKGVLLAGRMLIYDALEMSFRDVPINRNPRCPLCGQQPSITELRDEPGSKTGCDP